MLKFDSTIYPYPSRRNVMYAKNGMVATGSPLAAQAGLEILKKGGNAIDAAIATAAALTVVEPTGNGIGGDGFAILSVNNKMYGLNASGPSPKLIEAQDLLNKGLKEMPKYGFIPVNVAKLWKKAAVNFGKEEGEEFKYWFDTFTQDGKCPEIGDVVRLPDHADTLEMIGDTYADAFYKGELADKIDAFSKKYNGYLRKDDLEEFEAEWVEPITVKYHGYDVYELPPNGHGISALMALNILDRFQFEARETVRSYHTMIEAMKLAFVDVQKYVADPRFMKVTVEQLLSKAYAEDRAKLIGNTAIMPEAGDPFCGGTVYLAAADNEGNMISYIQSNYMGFGSGMVVPGTGIALHNRGNNFNLDLESANCVGPAKRPYHTIIPGFLGKDGKAIGPFGVMGGFMQPQGHVQVVTNTVDFLMNPQAALDAPRWQWVGKKNIELEYGVPEHIAYELAAMGHDVKVLYDPLMMGRGEIIWRMENGVLVGGTEPRTDGHIALY